MITGITPAFLFADIFIAVSLPFLILLFCFWYFFHDPSALFLVFLS